MYSFYAFIIIKLHVLPGKLLRCMLLNHALTTINFVFLICSWFHGDIKRDDAERKLMFTTVGTFLVRRCLPHYTLCLKGLDKVYHYSIKYADTYFLTVRVQFDTLQELIAYYRSQTGGLCTKLSAPFQLTEPPPTTGLSRKTKKASEIDRSSIYLQRQLGRGEFCEVQEGVWNGIVGVAVKVFKSGNVLVPEFLSEIALMKQFRHINILQVYGVCTQEQPIYMVMELVKHGSLLSYLRGDGRSLKLSYLVDMGAQVASGMAYLEEKNYIHQELAARNILVSEGLVCKVADFGLARVIGKAESSVKWRAPEAALYGNFTIKSDVWSFGILLYELITYGCIPYPGMSNAQVLEALQTGYHMPCPKDCPESLYQIMLKCWEHDAASRLTFETLHWQLDEFFNLSEQIHKNLSLN